MFSVNVAKNIDSKAMLNKIEQAKKRALKSTAMQFARVTDPYVRYDTGYTARSVAMSDYDNGKIEYDSPWAVYAYYNTNNKVNTEHHPLACAKWAEVSWNAKGEQLIQHFDKKLSEGLK